MNDVTQNRAIAGRRGYAICYLENITVGPEILDYMCRIESTFEPYGGAWLVHGAKPEVYEGNLPGDVVIIEFPSARAVRDWYGSPAYQAIAALRTDNSRSITAPLVGVPDGYRAAQTAKKMATN